jgi:TPP-dependent pyruvate/acetoin dehydrogenase alpha subunit
MAKIHEHRLRDFAAAHAVVMEALDRAHAHRAPAPVVEALSYRLARLSRRIGRPP